jgi:hypothetical protein
MVEPHVAGLAGLRLPGFLFGKGVAGVARIAGGHAEAGPGLREVFDLGLGFEADLMPQPFIPSVMAIGCQWIVGMASIAAQAAACLPLLNCLTWVS